MYDTENRSLGVDGPVLLFSDNCLGSIVTCSNNEEHNGDVLKIKKIKRERNISCKYILE